MSTATAPTPRARSRLHRPAAAGRTTAKPDSASTQRVTKGVTSSGRRARSRLRARHTRVRFHFAKPTSRLFRTGTPRFFPSWTGFTQLVSQLLATRAPFWPSLALSALSGATLVWMLTATYPQSVTSIGFGSPTVIPLAILLVATTGLAVFILAHPRRGLLFGLWSTTLAFLFVQSVAISPSILVGLALFALTLELLSMLLERYVAPRIPDQLTLRKRAPYARAPARSQRTARRPRAL